jgi:SagB-type dehydrogenase family enzyme
MKNDLIDIYRNFLKDSIRKTIDFSQTDQSKGIDAPPIQKEYSADQKIINLPKKEEWKSIKDISLCSVFQNRRSRRKYTKNPIKLDELSFLLWSTQGLRHGIDSGRAFRVVPSAGCRHSFETYLLIFNVTGLEEGIYRYLPVDNSLVFESDQKGLSKKINDISFGQSFIGTSAVVFIWTTIPYRMEWRYDIAAHRVIAIDVGHVCQNLYLACEAIDSGTCAIGAFDQEKIDKLINVDGKDEFVIYLAPVGKIS